MAENQTTLLSVIERIFSNWTALRMAVEHGNGSVDAARSFCDYINQTLSMNERLHYTDISGVLEDIMDEDFNTKLEDDSENQVAQDLVRFHNYITSNDLATLTNELQKLPPLQPWIIPNQNLHRVRARIEDDSDSDDTDENDQCEGANNSETGPSKTGMEVDSEGWSVVNRKRR